MLIKLVTQVPALSFTDKFSVFLSSTSSLWYVVHTPKMVKGPENRAVSYYGELGL
jgi:hypothetical protein